MLQQVMTAPKNISFREIPVPQPSPHEVQIRVEQIGICGSDIHVYHGQHPFTRYPVTQGHEVSGVVTCLGSEVRDLRLGQKVTVGPQVVCGHCYPCLHGKYNLCESLKVMGFQTTGLASEFFVVDAGKVIALPDSMSFAEGAMMEPLAVAVHAVQQAGDVAGQRLVVLGAGPIGNLVAQTALGLGAESVLMTDISDLRLSIAQACGIPHTLNTREANLGEAIAQTFGTDGADAFFDCAGTDITMDQAIRFARKGSQIILVAVFAKKATVDLALLNDHELCLNTSMMYRREHFEEAIGLVAGGKFHLAPLMSKTFPFRAYQEAYEYIDAHRESTMKVFIDVQA